MRVWPRHKYVLNSPDDSTAPTALILTSHFIYMDPEVWRKVGIYRVIQKVSDSTGPDLGSPDHQLKTCLLSQLSFPLSGLVPALCLI